MDWEPAALGNVQRWELCFAPRGTVQATARCLLRKPKRLKHGVVHTRLNLRANSNGAQPDATSGSIKAAVTIQFAETKLAITNGHVGG